MSASSPRAMRFIQQSALGGPDVLQLAEGPIPRPAQDEVLIRVAYSGVNFADLLARRTGNNHLVQAQLPVIPGGEVVGTSTESGERVVALCGTGGYAQWALAPRARTFPVPRDVDDKSALALFIQGLTAWWLYRCGTVKASDTVLVHAAAGGVGSLAVQIGRLRGARRIIATGSTVAKRELALTLGADAAIDSQDSGLTERILAANEGHPVDLIFERSGGAVLDASFTALALFGRMVIYGSSSGEASTIHARQLISRSRTVSGLWLIDALRDPALTRQAMHELFGWCARGAIRPVLNAVYPLAEAARAQIDMAERRTMGKVLLDANA